MYQLTKPDNVVECLERSVAKYPGRPYLGTKNKALKRYDWITYADFGKRVDNVRSALSQLGIQKDDAVGIICNNSTDWAVCFYAASGLDARFVPMYESELEQVWKYIITDAKVKLLFISKKAIYDKLKDFIAAAPALEKVIVMEGDGSDTLADLEKKGASRPVKSVYPVHSSICILIYTSGTTGEPKGVLLSHGNITSNAHATTVCFPALKENDCSLSILPWAHVFGLAELVVYCILGASIGIAESSASIGEDMLLVRPTYLTAVPRVFNKIYDGLWMKMNAEGGLAKALFVMGVESGKKKRGTGGAGQIVPLDQPEIQDRRRHCLREDQGQAGRQAHRLHDGQCSHESGHLPLLLGHGHPPVRRLRVDRDVARCDHEPSLQVQDRLGRARHGHVPCRDRQDAVRAR